jgi:hypothetical protein
VYSVAHPLRLDYTGLKKRLGGVSHRRRKAREPAFVELIAPSSAMLRECHATLYTESSDSFLPPLPPRLLPGGANQFPGGNCTREPMDPAAYQCSGLNLTTSPSVGNSDSCMVLLPSGFHRPSTAKDEMAYGRPSQPNTEFASQI